MDEIAESDPSDDDDKAPKISSAMASRKATRNMHQKLSSWLAAHYQSVLLPSFQTSEMVRRYTLEVASDATPSVASTTDRYTLEIATDATPAEAVRDMNVARNIFYKCMGLLA
ncbi:hypothetical protein V7S43_001113 [Phytophthora oleae]|uniref:Uncharacterized protein n=1 Tax=Phytophthora oleae TaxID=2107226 RepID=A0ABD3G5X1_9STRA